MTMGALMQCLRHCWEDDPEEEEQTISQQASPIPNSMARVIPTDEQEPPTCQRNNEPEPGPLLLVRFWNKLTKETHYEQIPTAAAADSPPRRLRCSPLSPLRTAISFDQSKEIPSIKTEEIVLPGSDLQHKMALKMCETLEEQGDECVICMDGFTPENPRMPTMCGCGENKTYFHLPCLYQWIEQNEDCPSCRNTLLWEEF